METAAVPTPTAVGAHRVDRVATSDTLIVGTAGPAIVDDLEPM